MKYKNLKELAAAFKSGELVGYKLILDNDDGFLQYVGPLPDGMEDDTDEADFYRDKKHDEAGKWYRGNGYRDLADACEAAGIPCEWC